MWNPFKKVKEGASALVPVGREMAGNIIPAVSGILGKDPDFEEVSVETVENGREEGSSSVVSVMNDGSMMALGMVHDVVSNALDVYRTSLQVEQNIAAIRAASNEKLALITSKFEFCKAALDNVFKERHMALSAHYSALDNAMKSNDREMIISALSGISSIVVQSPLTEFKELVSNWDSYSKAKPLELDF